MEVIDMIAQLDGAAFAFAMAFMALDIVSGYAKAAATKTIDSSKIRTGFWHKLAIVFGLLAAGLADMAVMVQLDMGLTTPIFEGACVLICVMELTSIAENIKAMNPELANTKFLALFGNGKEDGDD